MPRSLRFEAPGRRRTSVLAAHDVPTLDEAASASRLLGLSNTTSTATNSTANETTIASREEYTYETISFEDYAAVAEECLEFVSTDTHLLGEANGDTDGDGGGTVEMQIDENSSAVLRDPNVCSAYSQSTFVGCTNTNDIEMSLRETNGTIVTGGIVFPYDLWLQHQLGLFSTDESIATVEANMLRYLAGRLDFACDDPASGGIIGLSSNPIDDTDASFDACVTNPTYPLSLEGGDGDAGGGNSLKCLPMVGEMTYYVATTEDAATETAETVESDVFNGISIGASEDAFVAHDIVDVVLVDRSLIANITIKSGDADGNPWEWPSWPFIGAIIGGAVALTALLLFLVLLVRRHKEKKRRQAEVEARHPFDVSDWDADSVPEVYEINRDLGIVYKKSDSPDRTACMSVGDGCGADDSFTSWIPSFGSSE